MRQMKTTRSGVGAAGQGRPEDLGRPAARTSGTVLAVAWVAVLLAGIGWLYAPALRLFVESDHLAYLIDTFRWHGVWDTLANTYSYNRTRVVAPGDGGAFRPLLFALLALEKGVFGARMTGWYGLGILLHAVITLQLFEGCVACARLARRRVGAPVAAPGTPAERGLELAVAGAFAGFFAWNVKAACMVTWPHIHGYLVFIILTLLGFRLLAAFLTGQDAGRAVPRWLLPAAWGALLLAAFAHELG